jgi:hypothetical protein
MAARSNAQPNLDKFIAIGKWKPPLRRAVDEHLPRGRSPSFAVGRRWHADPGVGPSKDRMNRRATESTERNTEEERERRQPTPPGYRTCCRWRALHPSFTFVAPS